MHKDIPPVSVQARRRRAGVAILLVLFCLALISILILAFLSGAKTEYGTSKSFASGAMSKMLSESAINLVMVQIRQGTQTIDAQSGNRVAWASQPGMIRTYDDHGRPASFYKLYSDVAMVGRGSYAPGSDAPPADWSVHPALYTDLNEPSENRYPIVDGRGLAQIGGVQTYDANSDGRPDVEGFAVEPSVPLAGSNPVPMPVRWLYVLQDGTIVPGEADPGSPTAAKVPGATLLNPIVGRIAFWTDDECSKVNLNTASEGSFWNVPLADGRGERLYAANSPVRGEYQRIPGHPATVSLSSVFGRHFTGSAGAALDPLVTADRDKLSTLFSLTPRMEWGGSMAGTSPMTVTPGSAASPPYVTYKDGAGGALPPPAPSPLGAKTNRLYATVDECLLTPGRVPNSPLAPEDLQQARFFVTASSRAPEVTLFNTPRVSIWPITWPETTPITAASTIDSNPYFQNIAPPMLAAEEKLLAFCGTVKGDAYYFQRQKSQDPAWDYNNIPRNQRLYSYLQSLTSREIPGFGGDFLTKYAADRDQILTEIFDYIRSGPNLNNTVPDPGGPRKVKTNYNYAPSNNRLITWERGGGSVVPIKIGATKGAGRFTTITEAALVFHAVDRAEPVPANPVGTQNYINFVDPAGDPTKRPLGAQTTKLGVYLLLNPFNPMTGYVGNNAFFVAKIQGPSFRINGQLINFPSTSGAETLFDYTNNSGGFHNDAVGGMMGCTWSLGFGRGDGKSPRGKSMTRGSYHSRRYPFIGDPIAVAPQDTTFEFTGSEVTLEIYPVNLATKAPISTKTQTITLDFTQLNGRYGMPVAPRYQTGTPLANGADAPPAGAPEEEKYASNRYYFSRTNTQGYRDPITDVLFPGTWDMRNAQARATVNAGVGRFSNVGVGEFELVALPEYYNNNLKITCDTIISLKLNHAPSAQNGDLRLLAMTENVPKEWFVPHYGVEAIRNPASNKVPDYKIAHSLVTGGNAKTRGYSGKEHMFGDDKIPIDDRGVMAWSGANTSAIMGLPTPIPEIVGDFNNGFGKVRDGAIIPKPDDSTATIYRDNDGSNQTPFFGGFGYGGLITEQPYFSPARQLSGPVELGVLPSGVKAGTPWRQLAFNPNPADPIGHIGLATPPDHLLLDLFWMPMVQPYPISEPLSTAGKINLNYAIAPFHYIRRKTGLHAALKSVKLTAIPLGAGNVYKSPDAASGGGSVSNPGLFRFPIDAEKTLEQFDTVFTNGDLFVSASQICSIFLIPKPNPGYNPPGLSLPTDVASARSFWTGPSTRLTGANARQQPYAHLYSLLTTRSNTFQVHLRVQTLAKTKRNPGVFDQSKGDTITGEYRGSAIIERYIDANNPNLPDYATTFASDPNETLEEHYRFRVVNTKTFQ